MVAGFIIDSCHRNVNLRQKEKSTGLCRCCKAFPALWQDGRGHSVLHTESTKRAARLRALPVETVGCHPRAKKPAPGSFLRTTQRRPVPFSPFLPQKKHRPLPMLFWWRRWDVIRGLKNLPPAAFLRTTVRRPVRILTFLATKKAPAFADAFLVETVGFEPMTSRMRTERSTN